MGKKRKLKELIVAFIRIYRISPLDFLLIVYDVVEEMISLEAEDKHGQKLPDLSTIFHKSEKSKGKSKLKTLKKTEDFDKTTVFDSADALGHAEKAVSQNAKVEKHIEQPVVLPKEETLKDETSEGEVSNVEIPVVESPKREAKKKVKALMPRAEDYCPKYKVGWYAFEGEKYSPDPKAYPNCQGVVAWVNPDKDAPKGKRALVLLPDTIWSSWGCWKMVDATSLDDGMLNTQKILNFAKENNLDFPAAEWCASYCKNGVSKGEAFWPAVNQLDAFNDNIAIINQAMAQIGGKELYGICLSSSEHNCFSEMVKDFTSLYLDSERVCACAEVKDYAKDDIYEVDKHLEYAVHAVIAI